MRQLTWLDAAPLKHGVEVLPVDPDRESQGREPAVADHLIDGGRGQVQVPTGRLRMEPFRLATHEERTVAK